MRIKSCDLTGSNGIFNGIITRFIGREIKRTSGYRTERSGNGYTVDRSAADRVQSRTRCDIYSGICPRRREHTAGNRSDRAAVAQEQTVARRTAGKRAARYRSDNAAVRYINSVIHGRSYGSASGDRSYRASVPDSVTVHGTERGIRDRVDRSGFRRRSARAYEKRGVFVVCARRGSSGVLNGRIFDFVHNARSLNMNARALRCDLRRRIRESQSSAGLEHGVKIARSRTVVKKNVNKSKITAAQSNKVVCRGTLVNRSDRTARARIRSGIGIILTVYYGCICLIVRIYQRGCAVIIPLHIDICGSGKRTHCSREIPLDILIENFKICGF